MSALAAPATRLHCVRRTHAVIVGDVVEIHCRWCSSKTGVPVTHRWDRTTGEPLNDRHEAEVKTA